jgi:hypothetical protein
MLKVRGISNNKEMPAAAVSHKEDGLSHLVAEEKYEQKSNGIKPGYSGHNMFGKSPAQKWLSNNYGNFIILIL